MCNAYCRIVNNMKRPKLSKFIRMLVVVFLNYKMSIVENVKRWLYQDLLL